MHNYPAILTKLLLAFSLAGCAYAQPDIPVQENTENTGETQNAESVESKIIQCFNKFKSEMNTTSCIKQHLTLDQSTIVIYIQLESDSLPAKESRKKIVQRYTDRFNYRLEQLGISDAKFLSEGRDKFILLIPGDTQEKQTQIINQLGATATLEFRLVEDSADTQAILAGKAPVPPNMEILSEDEDRQILLHREVLLSGEYLQDAYTSIDNYGRKTIMLTFNKKGTELFYELTRQNISKRLAVVFVDSANPEPRVLSAPVIMEPISGGKVQISGDLGEKEAKNTVAALQSSIITAPMTVRSVIVTQ